MKQPRYLMARGLDLFFPVPFFKGKKKRKKRKEEGRSSVARRQLFNMARHLSCGRTWSRRSKIRVGSIPVQDLHSWSMNMFILPSTFPQRCPTPTRALRSRQKLRQVTESEQHIWLGGAWRSAHEPTKARGRPAVSEGRAKTGISWVSRGRSRAFPNRTMAYFNI